MYIRIRLFLLSKSGIADQPGADYNCLMKDTKKDTKPTQSTLAKQLATHAILVAIVTSPWLVSVFSDLIAITTNQTDASLQVILLNGLSALSTAALLIGVGALIWYFFSRKKA